MSALSYVYSRLDDSSLVEFGKAAGVPVGKAAGVPVGKAAGVPVGKAAGAPSRWEQAGLVTNNDERKARIKGGLPGITGYVGGAGLALTGAHRGSKKMQAAGLVGAAGGLGATAVGAHRAGNKSREKQGLKRRNALGFIGKRGARGALRATGRKVRGGKTPVRRDFSPPSALGTNQPGKAQPEWMRSYGSPGPKTGW